ncbi:MAG: LysE family transporter [Anaerolineae bacterium]
MIPLLLQGLVVGFSIAAPVGPIGVLCIRRTLAEGRSAGFISGLGAATADTIYGCIAGFGLTFLSSFLVDQQLWLRLIGGLFLCYLGVRAFLAEPAAQTEAAHGRGLAGAYGSTFLLTLTNPMTILPSAAIFAGLGAGEARLGHEAAMVLVLGVFVGSVLWWFALSGIASLFRERFDVRALRWVNRVSGFVVAGFAVAALVSLL